ncbi:hypothetical protein K501DRAFT_266987 [Backusella circina FSU 941]|nr:hypothetical protein K501DRAFT_266987 [Backusella circina FSU 941]
MAYRLYVAMFLIMSPTECYTDECVIKSEPEPICTLCDGTFQLLGFSKLRMYILSIAVYMTFNIMVGEKNTLTKVCCLHDLFIVALSLYTANIEFEEIVYQLLVSSKPLCYLKHSSEKMRVAYIKYGHSKSLLTQLNPLVFTYHRPICPSNSIKPCETCG